MPRERKLAGIGAFARACLAEASRQCAGKPFREFQACRKQYIQSCRAKLSYAH